MLFELIDLDLPIYDVVISKQNSIFIEEEINDILMNSSYISIKIEWWDDPLWYGKILLNNLCILYIVGRRRGIDIRIRLDIQNIIFCREFFTTNYPLLDTFKQCKFMFHSVSTRNLTELDGIFSDDIPSDLTGSVLVINSKEKFSTKEYINATKETIDYKNQYDFVIIKGLIDGKEMRMYSKEDIGSFISLSKSKIIIISNKNEISNLSLKLAIPIHQKIKYDNLNYLSSAKDLDLFITFNSLTSKEKQKVLEELNPPFHKNKCNGMSEIIKELVDLFPHKEKVIKCSYKGSLGVKDVEQGIYLLILKYLNRDTKWEHSFTLLKEGERWCKKMFSVLCKKKNENQKYNYQILRLQSSLWMGHSIDSCSNLQIIKGIGPRYAITLKEYLSRFAKNMQDLTGMEIDSILNRNPPFGYRIRKEISNLPCASLEVSNQEKEGIITINYSIKLKECKSAELCVEGESELQTHTIYNEEVMDDRFGKVTQLTYTPFKYSRIKIYILSKWSITIDLLKILELDKTCLYTEERKETNKTSSVNEKPIKRIKKSNTLKEKNFQGKFIRSDGCDSVNEIFYDMIK